MQHKIKKNVIVVAYLANIFHEIYVNNMIANGLPPCIAWPSAPMVLDMQSKEYLKFAKWAFSYLYDLWIGE